MPFKCNVRPVDIAAALWLERSGASTPCGTRPLAPRGLAATLVMSVWRRRSSKRGLAGRLLRLAVRVALPALALAVLLVAIFRFVNPPVTYLMVREWWRLGAIERDWVRLDAMADYLPLSAAAAEDANFCRHRGFDLAGIRAALADDGAAARRQLDQPAGGEERLPLAGPLLAPQGARGRVHPADRGALEQAADHGGLPQRRRDGRGRLRRRGRGATLLGRSRRPSSGRSARRG